MDKKEIVNFLIKEKELEHNNYRYHDDQLSKLLVVFLTGFVGIFALWIEKDLEIVITIFPVFMIYLGSRINTRLLLAYSSDCAIRIYERVLNEIIQNSIYFKYNEFHNVFHNHDEKFGYSKQTFANNLTIYIVPIGFIIYCIFKGHNYLIRIGKVEGFLYLFSCISLSLSVLISFLREKKKLDKTKIRVEQKLLEQYGS